IQKEKKLRLGEALLQTQVPKADIAKAMEEVQGVTFAECPDKIAPEVLALISRAIAIRCCALPLELNDRTLTVALADPQNLAHLDELRFCPGKIISPRFTFKEDLVATIKKFYPEDKEQGSRKGSKSGPADIEFDKANFGDV